MAGVCGTDVKYLHGKRQQMPLPIILGHEILGRVVKLGAEAASIHGPKGRRPHYSQRRQRLRRLRSLPPGSGEIL
jgi:NADPH:quinone reductase-like Zn-dependent oxidoreductase